MFKEKKTSKVSLNIKVPSELDEKLKDLRSRARDLGLIFNVSEEVVGFLEKRVKRAEKELSELEGEKKTTSEDQVKSAVEEEFGDHPAIRGTDNYQGE